jgi:hypothetical protein
MVPKKLGEKKVANLSDLVRFVEALETPTIDSQWLKFEEGP